MNGQQKYEALCDRIEQLKSELGPRTKAFDYQDGRRDQLGFLQAFIDGLEEEQA